MATKNIFIKMQYIYARMAITVDSHYPDLTYHNPITYNEPISKS